MAKTTTTTASAAADDARTTPRDRGCTPVLVTTERRLVAFGWAAPGTDFTQPTIRIEGVRNCIKWSRTIGGFLGLAAVGPNEHCTIGALVPGGITLRGVTSVTECSPDAVKRWEAAPCVS
jgi:hypothetical protein